MLAVRPRLTGDYKDFNPSESEHIYEGTNRIGVMSWLMTCSLDLKELKFKCKDQVKSPSEYPQRITENNNYQYKKITCPACIFFSQQTITLLITSIVSSTMFPSKKIIIIT